MQVLSDADVIALRQAIRQTARAAGLSAAQQARITAAISEVARALLTVAGDGCFTIRLDDKVGARPALEIACSAGPAGAGTDINPVYALPAVSEARALVDDTQVETAEHGPRLLMRMWLAGTPPLQ